MIVRLKRSRVGRAWAAIREDEDAAEAMGVPTFKMKLWAFAIGASTGGLGGWIYASRVSFINPDNFPFFLSVILLSAVVLGGMGSIPGVIVGAFAVAFLPEYLRDVAAGETLTRWLNTITRRPRHQHHRVPGAAVRAGPGGDDDLPAPGPAPQPPAGGGAGRGHRPSGAWAATVEAPVVGGRPRTRRRPRLPVPRPTRRAGAEPPPLGATGGDAGAAGRPPAPDADGRVLELDGLRMEFGGVVALQGVDVSVERGEILALIGPNGAGKTTVFNCVTGVFRPTGGRHPPRRRRRSAAPAPRGHPGRRRPHVPEHPPVPQHDGPGERDDRGRLPPPHERARRPVRPAPPPAGGAGDAGTRPAGCCDLVGIDHRAGDLARNLPYGDQRRLEIARAVATRPRVLLLDEPAAGMGAAEKQAADAP